MVPEHLGANRRLTQRDLQRLYANPNSTGFILLCLPVLGLALGKAALGAVWGGVWAGAAAFALAVRSLPRNLSKAACTAWRTKSLGLVSRALTLALVLPATVLVWPLALLGMGLAQGAQEAGSMLFNRTSDSLQPAGQHSFMFVEDPWAAGWSMALAELRCLVARLAHLVDRDLPAWLDKHAPPAPSSSSCSSSSSSSFPTLASCSSSTATKGMAGLVAAGVAAAAAVGDVEQPATDAADTSQASLEERLARGVAAGLVAVVGGVVGALGMVVLGACHTGKVSVFAWRQLAHWASFVRPQATSSSISRATTTQQQQQQQQQQQSGSDEASKEGAAATGASPCTTTTTTSNRNSSAMGMLASAAALPALTNSASAAAKGPLRLSQVSMDSSVALASVAEDQDQDEVEEEHEQEAGKPDGQEQKPQRPQQQQQQPPPPQRSSDSGSSSSASGHLEGGEKAACTATATLVAPTAAPSVTACATCPPPAERPSDGAGCGAEQTKQQRQQHHLRRGACLRWVAAAPVFPFVPLAVAGFFLLASLTWLVGGAMMSMAGAWRATSWAGVFAGGLEPVVEALESLHQSVVQTCARAAKQPGGPSSPTAATAPPARKKACARKSPGGARAAGGGPLPTLPQPAQHLAINIAGN